MNIEKARFNMIEQQIKPWNVFDERLLGAMATIPREQFVPDDHHNVAYADTAIPLGHHQFMLAPRELARLIQALQLTGNEKVLDIGCGSGYSCAILSKLARKVYSVDIIAEFVTSTQKRLKKLSFTNVYVEEADAAQGWLAQAPYDAVLMTSLLPSIPENLVKSLKPNGRIAAIIGSKQNQTAIIGQLDKDGELHIETLFPVETALMINAEIPNKFEF